MKIRIIVAKFNLFRGEIKTLKEPYWVDYTIFQFHEMQGFVLLKYGAGEDAKAQRGLFESHI